MAIMSASLPMVRQALARHSLSTAQTATQVGFTNNMLPIVAKLICAQIDSVDAAMLHLGPSFLRRAVTWYAWSLQYC